MIYEFFVLGGVFFWILFALAFIVLLIEVVTESFGWAIATFIAFCVLVFGFSNIRLSWFTENQHLLYLCFIGYFIGAIITSFLKWYFFVHDEKERYDDFKSRFLKMRDMEGETIISEELKVDWANFLNENYLGVGRYSSKVTPIKIIPNVKDNKVRIIGWMSCWPFVAFWSLFNDIFRRIWEVLYRIISSLYQSISNFAFKDISEDLPSSLLEKKSSVEED